MTEVYLLVGCAIGDVDYYVAESAELDKIVDQYDNSTGDQGWYDICAVMGNYCETAGEDAHDDVFKSFVSALEAVKYCQENDLTVKEEVEYTVY